MPPRPRRRRRPDRGRLHARLRRHRRPERPTERRTRPTADVGTPTPVRRHLYALIRCVPNTATGEFINIGAIALNPHTGDWAIRRVTDDSHARKLADSRALDVAFGFITDLAATLRTTPEPASEEWLARLHHDHRNIVQLSQPAPIVADSTADALDVVFKAMIVDPGVSAGGEP